MSFLKLIPTEAVVNLATAPQFQELLVRVLLFQNQSGKTQQWSVDLVALNFKQIHKEFQQVFFLQINHIFNLAR